MRHLNAHNHRLATPENENPPSPPLEKGGKICQAVSKSPFGKGGFRGILGATFSIKEATIGLLALLLLFSLPLGVRAAAPDVSLTVVPGLVEIGISFTGSRLTVSGEIPAGSQALLEVRGESAAEGLMRKGRRGGLWMNVGEIEIEGAPSLYLAMTSHRDLLASGAGQPWGYEALQQKVRFTGQIQGDEVPRFFREFLQLKESEGLYGLFPGTLKTSGGNPERTAVRGTFELPAKIAPGLYQVCLSAIEEGRVLCQKTVPLKVEMVGFPAALTELAYQHGALHGILAVIIAIVVGFVMGFVFKGKGGAH